MPNFHRHGLCVYSLSDDIQQNEERLWSVSFTEIKPQLFKNKALELYSDSFTLVNQVNNRMYCSKDLEPFRNMALLMKKKIPYSLNLIPESDNPAQQAMGIN